MISTTAYAVLKQDAVDVDEEDASIAKTSSTDFPDAREMTWNDTYFEETGTDGVIAVFDLDYDLARKRVRNA